ncbi:MAG: type IV secretion protein Rhs [Bacillota bacterium]|nr:type IV secretion protein Rhs [Bacillota bacterium]
MVPADVGGSLKGGFDFGGFMKGSLSEIKDTLKSAWTFNKGQAEVPVVDEYGILKNNDSITGQAHHLNQNAAYRDVIPRDKGLSVRLEGNAFTQSGTSHYGAYASLENFWNQFRRGGEKYGEVPTNLEYSKALFDSLQGAGFTRNEALDITRQAMIQRVQYGLLGGEPVPRIPGKINQVR